MIRRFFEKEWAQYTALGVLLGIVVYYFAFLFHFDYEFNWSVLFKETQYGHMGKLLISGLNLTITISIISAALALTLGTIFGLARLSSFKPVYWFASSYVEFFRNTPLLIQLFFWNFALPMAFPEDVRKMLFELDFEFWVAVLGLGIYTSSFMAEIIRAGIQSIPKGLLEASYASGLTLVQTLRRVILPLAFREIIPPLGSEFLNNMKNSSLAMTVGVAELCWCSQEIESALTYSGFEATAAATGCYLGLSLIISGFLNLVDLRMQILPAKDKKTAHKVAETFFLPFTWPLEAFSSFWRRTFRPKPAGVTLTPAQAMLHKTIRTTVFVVTQTSKIVFVAALVWLLYMAVRGAMNLNYEIIFKNLRAMLIWRFPNGTASEVFWGLGGYSLTLIISVICISVSFFIGLFVGMGRSSKNKLFQIPSMIYIEIIRGNPLIMVIFWVYFFLPVVIKVQLDVFWSAVIAMTVFTGAYIAEIVRAGIQNVNPGHIEAAYSTGLTHFQTMRKVVLPQALKQMLPAIVGQFISIFKDTSLAYIIGVMELTTVAYSINNRLMLYPFEIYTTVALLYFLSCYFMSILAGKLEKRLSADSFRLEM